MSRGVYLLGVGLVLVAGAFLLTDALTWRPGVSVTNMRRVRPGMTPEQVTAIFGRYPEFKVREWPWEGEPVYTRIWSDARKDPSGCVWVHFRYERVVGVEWRSFRQAARSPALDRFRGWLGW